MGGMMPDSFFMSISFSLFSFREQRQPVVVFVVFRGLQYGGRRDIFPRMLTTRQKHIAQVLGCLTLVYISWGSCFISIKFAIESFPPFMMCGLRIDGLRACSCISGVGREWGTQLANPQGPLPKFRSRVLHGVHGQRFPPPKGRNPSPLVRRHDPRRGAHLDGARRLAVLRRSPAFVSAVLRARDRLCGLILLSVNQTASGTDSGWGILLVLCAAFGG